MQCRPVPPAVRLDTRRRCSSVESAIDRLVCDEFKDVTRSTLTITSTQVSHSVSAIFGRIPYLFALKNLYKNIHQTF